MRDIRRKRALRLGAQFGAAILLPFLFSGAGPAPVIPIYSTTEFGWIAQSPNFQLPASGPHHVTQHPNHAWKAAGRGEAPMWRIADLDNPILQPWAREELKRNNERILAGGTGYTRQVSCWPMGTPAFLLYPAQPIYFIQTPDKVTLIAQLDHQVRHIYMNVPHSKNVKPSWYGESIGHYEGDTLVVDTVGIHAKNTWVDNFRTPHSDKLHVVERFRIVDGGKTLQVDLHVEDEGAYTTPWNAVQRYDRADQEFVEYICAENNVNIGDLDPMPEAKTPDF